MAQSTKPKSATSYKDTAFGVLPRVKIVEFEGEAVKKAQEHIIKLSEQKTFITPQIIKNVHREGFGFIFPDWAGNFRTIDVTVGDYEPPHYSRIPEMIQSLCDDLLERLNHLPLPEHEEQYLGQVISVLAWFQHRFVWIHPFNDYNGRVARLLTNLILLNLGFTILTIKAETGKDRDKYIEALKVADQHDFTKLESLLALALHESLEKT